MMRKRLYVIGIDSAPLWIIKRLSKKYHMLGFEEFFKNGILKDMRSTLPPLTPVAWPSIYTGLEPREHGMMDFFRIDREYTKQLLYFDSDRCTTFWDRLASKGLRSLVITPAVVLKPSESDNVDMVTGWPLQPRFSSKEIEEAAKRFGFSGEAEIEKALQDGTLSLAEAQKRYAASIKSRSELSKYLIGHNDYHLAFICFTETDRMQHYSLNNPEWERYIAPLYKGVSDFIEWVVAHSRKNNEQALTILVSDHGAQPVHLKFLLNAWLINSGYAILKPGIAKQFTSASKGEGTNVKYALRERLMKSGARKLLYDKLPESAKRLTGKLIGNVLSGGSGKDYIHIHDFDFEMGKTLAFTSVSNDPVGMIWLNDSRFSKPSVRQTQRTRLKNDIIKGLNAIKTEDGKRLVMKIYGGDEYYKNTRRFIPPDLLLAVREGYVVDVKNYSADRLFMKPELAKSGDHTASGIFGILANNYILNKGAYSKELSVYDIYPTILKFFGVRS